MGLWGLLMGKSEDELLTMRAEYVNAGKADMVEAVDAKLAKIKGE